MRVYAIGDIHGYLSELRRAHDLIDADRVREKETGAEAPVVHLGDLVDRGPDSRGVIDFILNGRQAGREWIVLKGNHDRLFARYMRTGDGTDGRLRAPLTWTSGPMGGDKTLASYGVTRRTLESDTSLHTRAREVVPEAHIAFMERLPLTYISGPLLFVHAGIRPGVSIVDQKEDDLVWIRDEFLWDLTDHPWLVVHGHTPVEEPSHYGNRVNLDTGAGYGHPITAAVFEDEDVWILTEKGRIRLPAPY